MKSVIPPTPPLFRLNPTAMSGQTFVELTERCLIANPRIAEARDFLICYHISNRGQPLFTETSKLEKDSSMDQYMKALCDVTGHEDDLPPHTIRREEDGDEPAEVEIRARWLVHDWEDLPEFNLARNITMLHMVRQCVCCLGQRCWWCWWCWAAVAHWFVSKHWACGC